MVRWWGGGVEARQLYKFGGLSISKFVPWIKENSESFVRCVAT